MNNIRCHICEKLFTDKKKFGYHLQFVHKIKVENYVIQHTYKGKRPSCFVSECENETRYNRTSYSFKKYCKLHSRIGMSEAGKVGGQHEAWNKNKTKKDDIRIMKLSTTYSGSGNPFYNKNHTQESIDKIRNKKTISKIEFEKRIKDRCNDFKCYTKYNEYYSRQHQYLSLECLECGTLQNKTLQAFERNSLCWKCFPCSKSQGELEIFNFVESLGFNVDSGDRNIIAPYEIDIIVKDKNLGIEYNGLYWHSEENGTDKALHSNKRKMMNSVGYDLLHIFSDDWRDKKELLKSMIKNRLGMCDKKVFARKCSIREISTSDAKDFLDKNHISGYVNSSWKVGLFHEGVLVAVMTIRKPRQKKYKNYLEIARFACLKHTLVIGGFSKALKKAESYCFTEGYNKLISYCDLSYGVGKVYKLSGFDFAGETGINYWYCTPEQRFDRFKFRAQNGKSEKEIAMENKVSKIYGCGNSIWIKKI